MGGSKKQEDLLDQSVKRKGEHAFKDRNRLGGQGNGHTQVCRSRGSSMLKTRSSFLWLSPSCYQTSKLHIIHISAAARPHFSSSMHACTLFPFISLIQLQVMLLLPLTEDLNRARRINTCVVPPLQVSGHGSHIYFSFRSILAFPTANVTSSYSSKSLGLFHHN